MCTFPQCTRRREAPVARCVGRRRAEQRRTVVDVERAPRFGRTAQGRRRVIRATTRNDCARDGTNVVRHTGNNRRCRRRNIASHCHRCRQTRVAGSIAGGHGDLRTNRQRRRRRIRPRATRIGRDGCIRRAVAIRVDLDRCAGFRRTGQRRPIRRVHRWRSRCRRIHRQIERGTRRAYVARRIRCRDCQAMCTFAQCARRREAPVARCIGRRRAEQRRAVVNTDRATCLCGTRESRRRIVGAATGNECARDRTNIVDHAGDNGCRGRRNIASHRHCCRRTRVARCVAGRHADLRAKGQRRRRRVRPCTARIGRYRCIRCAVAVRIDLDRRTRFGRTRQRSTIRRIHRRRSRRRRIDRQIECCARQTHVARCVGRRHRNRVCAFTETRRRRERPVPRRVGRCRAEQRRTVEYADRAARFGRTAQRRCRVVGAATGNDCARD
ncbi:hypothetical protein FEP16_05166 [Burkholderia multivorans]|nr:hypothetical protein [Burkholderia multivorans]MDR9184026.1 hypothetical protein [Burkholderia multivorans]MDR9305470.1 hypothetical protein [Burkholderia multivorans]